MRFFILHIIIAVAIVKNIQSAPIEQNASNESLVHFGFQTENGQYRTEDIKFNTTDKHDKDKKDSKSKDVIMPVEYKGGYSFISADGYEYTVLYKANKNGFQPYVTAHKIKSD